MDPLASPNLANNGVVELANGHTGEPPSQISQTATDYITSQLRLEADAREILPFSFDHCTQPLGPLRQNLFSCLTCNPPPSSPSDHYTPSAVCYSCSIACHGEHTLVELLQRRNFVCDCGTTRLPSTSPCTLRIDPATGLKRPVHSQEAAAGNTYNHNAKNSFCDCEDWYDADKEKGTMFQCLGLKGEEEGGCGEDWWHPECVIWGGVEGKRRRKEAEERREREKREKPDSLGQDDEPEETKLPIEFPEEENIDTFICYKCVNAVPWLKQYAGTEGFLPAVPNKGPGLETNGAYAEETDTAMNEALTSLSTTEAVNRSTLPSAENPTPTRKRSADDADLAPPTSPKKAKADPAPTSTTTSSTSSAYHTTLPPAPSGSISLFCKADFREQLCRCKECYPRLSHFPQLLEEEDTYEPPLSEDGERGDREGSVGSKSILERGEEALTNVDRVRAIEGVMVYNHLKDKVKTFLQPFAESGQAVSAEDIKAYFEKLRGDEQGINAAGDMASATDGEGGLGGKGGAGGEGGTDGKGGGGTEEGNRREQSGY